uniref:Proton-coupled folate transporter n=1 Tax=Zeugodacus cucurbitae TaxID=28588 RepID=A0A0A1WLL2_ZEUCU
MGRNEFENNTYHAANMPNVTVYVQDSMSEPATNGYDRTVVEDVNSSQTIVTDSDIDSNTQQLNPLRRIFILEPPVFLLNFASSLSSVVFTNQLLYQSCRVTFGHTEAECEPMLGISNATINHDIENQVQPYVSRIILANSLVSSILPAILALFIGAWSDRFGRRPVLLISLIGIFLGYIVSFILAMVSAKSATNPWLYVIAQIPAAVTGSTCAFMIVCYCYIADVAPPLLKGLKMVLNDAAIGAGSVIGTLAGSALFAKTSMQVVFAISAAALLVAFVYIYFVNEESLKVTHTSLGYKLCQFFSISHVIDLVRTCVAKRANYMRTFIWFAMIALIITNFTSAGEGNVFYLFLRAKFNATVSQYSDYNSIGNGIQIIGGIIAVVAFRKYLRLSFVTMAMLSLLSAVCESTVRAAAQKFWEMYLGTALGFMAGIIGPMLLTILAFVTPTNETGKIFSVTTALQTITPLGASPLYTSVYDATLSYYPGMFNIISAILYFISFLLVAVILIVSKRKEITVSPPSPPRV